jgi:hypothetical protein
MGSTDFADASGGPLTGDTLIQTNRIPADIRAVLSPDQISDLVDLMLPPTSNHSVDYRVSSSVLGQKFYLNLFVGSEQRSQRRVLHDNQRRSFSLFLIEATLVSLAISLLVCGIAAVVVLALYAITPEHGVDLFDGAAQIYRFFID